MIYMSSLIEMKNKVIITAALISTADSLIGWAPTEASGLCADVGIAGAQRASW